MSQENHTPEHRLTIAVIGDHGVGKSSLINRYTDRVFSTEVADVQKEQKHRKVTVGGVDINVTLTVIKKPQQSDAKGLMIVYDPCNEDSFNVVNKYYEQAKKHAPDACIVLVANKCDVVEGRVIGFSVARDYAAGKELPFFELSAKNDSNVEQTFQLIVNMVIQKFGADGLIYPPMVRSSSTSSSGRKDKKVTKEKSSGDLSSDRSSECSDHGDDDHKSGKEKKSRKGKKDKCIIS
eukprot:TRINITY_DN5832_c0_g1_i1.p1 TRINITY_DN5832_c0_g1~~TRINITY_DN5832_c0_g1_i1.p1  ORF type:complete len:236 (+),score=49.16 TRINITY_DN5832_c0_g1_i1:136-843(+)